MRKEFEGRPLLGILAALIVGLTAGQHLLNLLLIPLLFVVWLKLETRLWIAAALAIGVLLAPPATPPARARTGELSLVVTSVPRLYSDAITFEAEAGPYRLLAKVPNNPEICLGDRLVVVGSVRPRPPEDRFLESKGLQGRLYAQSFRLESSGPTVYRWADGWRRSFLAFAKQGLPDEKAHVISALCFNTDSLLDDDTKESLRRTGTIHIVSVSGMHVFVFAISLLWLLSRAPIPRWAQLLVLAIALSFYAVTVGLNAPVVRAVLMSLIGAVAYLFGREKDWLSALALAGILNLIWQPRSVYDMGFQLSFVTVAAFILYLRDAKVTKAPLVVGKAREIVRASLVASLASAPLVAYHFGEIPVLGILANVLIAPVVPVAIVGAFIAHGLWFVAPPVGTFVLDWLCGSLIGYVEVVLDLLADQSWATVSFPEFSGYVVLLCYAPLLMIWRPVVRQP